MGHGYSRLHAHTHLHMSEGIHPQHLCIMPQSARVSNPPPLPKPRVPKLLQSGSGYIAKKKARALTLLVVTGYHFFIHSFAANGNIGLSGQAQWLPVAMAARDYAPKSPTVSSSHATTRVKQVSAPRGPAHYFSYHLYGCRGRTTTYVLCRKRLSVLGFLVEGGLSSSYSVYGPNIVVATLGEATSDPELCTALCTQKGR